MADNVVADPGVGGATFRTDELAGSIHVPFTKLMDGTDASTTVIVSGNGVASGALRVTLASDSTGVLAATQSGSWTVAATQSGTWNVANSGTFAVQAVCTNAGTFAVQATCTNAGTFAVQAAQSGTWNITNISGTVSLPTGAATAAKQPALGTAGAASSDVISIQGISSMTPIVIADGSGSITVDNGGTFAVQVSSIAAGNNNIGDVDVASIAAGDNNIGNVDIVTVPTDPFGANADSASATGSISAKLRFIASTGIPITGTVTVGSHAVTNAGTFAVQPTAAATGGATPGIRLFTSDTNAAVIKNGAGTLYSLSCVHIDATPVYIKLYDKATTPDQNDTPVQVYALPANSTAALGAGAVISLPACGLVFSSGISIRIVTGIAHNSTGAVTADEGIVSYSYK